jgi:hypothetical protein
MLKRALAIGIVAVVLAPTAASALYRDTFSDANDLTTPNDLRSTTRAVVAPHGRRVLRIVMVGYERWPHYPDFFQALIRLDTRGGGDADATLRFSSGGDIGCVLSLDDEVVSVYRHGTRAACRVHMSRLHANKRIRWKVVTTYRHGGHPDYAPDDRGWFV